MDEYMIQSYPGFWVMRAADYDGLRGVNLVFTEPWFTA